MSGPPLLGRVCRPTRQGKSQLEWKFPSIYVHINCFFDFRLPIFDCVDCDLIQTKSEDFAFSSTYIPSDPELPTVCKAYLCLHFVGAVG